MHRARFFTLVSLGLGAAAPAQGLVWGTMFDGNRTDAIHAVATDAQGRVFVCGLTSSTDLPMNGNPLQPSYGGGTTDGFVACFDPSMCGSPQLVWATYLGGAGEDVAFDLVVDPAGQIVTVVGYTDSSNYFGTTPQGGRDGFVVHLDLQQAAAQQLVWARRLGGRGDLASAVVASGSLLTVAGQTAGQGFPVTQFAVQPAYGGGQRDAFVAQLYTASGQLAASTFLGGTGDEGVWSSTIAFHNRMVRLAVDGTGDVFVAGPVWGAFRQTTTGRQHPVALHDTFVCRLTSSLSLIRYATLEGGGSDDYVRDLAIDREVPSVPT